MAAAPETVRTVLRLTRIVALGLLSLFAMAARAGAQQPPAFTLGSTRDDVRRLLGAPDVIERLTQLGVEIWNYRTGSVRFDPASGRVNGWDDPRGRLFADALPRGARTTARDIVLGSSGTDVIRLLGRPRQVRRSGALDQWGYTDAVIAIAVEDGRVAGWRDPRHRLPVRRAQDRQAQVVFGAGRGGRSVSEGRPRLLVNATLRDTSADGRSAGATNALVVTIENAGPGTAYSVAPVVTVPAGVATVSSGGEPVPSLAAGHRVVREFALSLGSPGADSLVEFDVSVADADGVNDASTLRLPVRLASTPRPRLVVERVELDDQSGDGRLSPREMGELTVFLRHTGATAAAGLRAELTLGRDVFAAAGTPPRFSLARLAPGETTSLRFSIYTTTRAESATVAIVVSDASGRYTQRLAVPVPLERSAFGSRTVTVAQDDVNVDGDITSTAPINDRALAVVFGIDRYRFLPPARFAARDAISMRRHLTALLGVPDDNEHLYLRTEADATGAEFRKVFGPTGWLARRSTPQSDIVVFYAGHGVAGPGGEPMLLPWDADPNYVAETGISLGEVYEALAAIPARSITIVLDACFTGLTRSGAPLVEGTRPIVLSVEHPALLRDGMTVFAAAQGAQVAGDLSGERHGLFSYWMMRGLRGEADADGDARLTIGELQDFVTREVARGSARQDREQRPLVITRDTSRVVLRVAAGRPR